MRVIAIDWSGRKTGEREYIYRATIEEDGTFRLENRLNRDETFEWLVQEKQRDPDFVVGLDFAFSFPQWFVQENLCRSPNEVWSLVDDNGEKWLEECQPPFWGRTGTSRPSHAGFRKTESEICGKTLPKSVFQINGAGSVGTGSLRGMPYLLRLQKAGFHVWPFDAPTLPLVIEIYPRCLTGDVRKSNKKEREIYLSRCYPNLSPVSRSPMIVSKRDDAFDAGVSALVMHQHRDSFQSLSIETDQHYLMEGKIWRPNF